MEKLLQTFGRRRGRKLRPYLQELYDKLLPKLRINAQERINLISELFPTKVEETWLEIGFGGGEHIKAQLDLNPQLGIIGCEPFANGVANLLKQLTPEDTQRLRLHDNDVRQLFTILPEGQLSRIYILFPDPWPKFRHHKRRLIQVDFINQLTPLLKPGGQIRIGTDDHPYAEHIMEVFRAIPQLRQLQGPTDPNPTTWSDRPEDWPQTRYEKKAITKAGFFVFQK
jgi:tRNA (guanine-N7-)-methyltransferase